MTHCWRPLDGAAAVLLVAALMATAPPIDAAAQGESVTPRVRESQVSFFVGKHVDNTWQDVFRSTNDLEYSSSGLIGLAIGHDWRRPGGRFSYGIELQADWQFGDQYHLEFNLPVFARYHLPERAPALRSLAFGVGPSYATRVPDYEVDSRGDSQQFMMYWAMEAEFGGSGRATSFFTRLHHRSGMFGVVAEEGASNALVLGVRRRW